MLSLPGKEASIEQCSDNIVESMTTSSDPKPANREQNREINARYRPEYEPCHGETLTDIDPAVQEKNVVVGAKQSSRYHNRKNYRSVSLEMHNILEQKHQQYYQYQTKNQFLIDPRTDTRYNIDKQTR